VGAGNAEQAAGFGLVWENVLGKICENLANLGEMWEKLGQIWAKVNKIWANLIRFGQNQSLASPKTLDLLRICLNTPRKPCLGRTTLSLKFLNYSTVLCF